MAKGGNCSRCGGGTRTARGGQSYLVDAGDMFRYELVGPDGVRINRFKSAIAAATAAAGKRGVKVRELDPPEAVAD